MVCGDALLVTASGLGVFVDSTEEVVPTRHDKDVSAASVRISEVATRPVGRMGS